MKPTTALTRARTLQERLGNRQDGSSGVRSTGRHAEEVITDLRQNGDEEVEENDYFNELRSPEIITKATSATSMTTWSTTSTPTRFP